MSEEMVVEEQAVEEQAVEIKDELTVDQLTSLDDAALDKAISDQKTSTDEPKTEPKPEEAKPEVKTETLPKILPTGDKPADDVGVIKEELERLKKRVQDKEQFIQRQGTEIGELRKARAYYEDQAKLLMEQFQAKFYENPNEAMNAYGQAGQATQMAQQAQLMESIQVNKQYIHQVYPEYETMINDIAEYGDVIGVPKDQIESFKQNPYATDIRVLIPYVEGAKRYKQEKTQSSLIEQLKKQVEELDKDTSEDTVLQKITAAARKNPAITAKSGDGMTIAKTDGLNENNIADLSDADLDALLKEAK